MSANALENPVSSYRQLTPEDHGLLRKKVTKQASALRGEFLREVWRQICAWYERRIALAQLRGLDDAALKDIGLHRSGIEAAVDEGPTRGLPQPRRAFAEKPYLCRQRN